MNSKDSDGMLQDDSAACKVEDTNEAASSKDILVLQRDMYARRAETAFKELRKAHEELQKQREENVKLRDEYTALSWEHYEVVHAASWRYTWIFRYIYSVIKKHFGGGKKTHPMFSPEHLQAIRDGLWFNEIPTEDDAFPLVSVIVPNYNHEPYLRERLESIYNQTYPNFEVILLDDCSTDGSRAILSEYAELNSHITRTCFNETNCGSIFTQWERGISMAKGSLIWIAESDDYCKSNFLNEMVPSFKYESVMLAFARSVFMQDGKMIWSTEEYLHDLKELNWNKPFMMTAHTAVQRGFALKNLIPNVSSAMFRNPGTLPESVKQEAASMRLTGDWMFYLTIMMGGTIRYTNATTNFYRIHEQSTSLKTQVTADYYTEFEQISKFVARNYNVDSSIWDKSLENLKTHYKAMRKTDEGIEQVESWYRISEIKKEAEKRKPNIAMACFDLMVGGGEIYPLYLANEMKKQGYAVTLFDFNLGKRNPKVRDILDKNIPLVRLDNLHLTAKCLGQMGIEIVHSHHGSVDSIIAGSLIAERQPGNISSPELADTINKCKQVITLHGMYEAIEDKDLQPLLDKVSKTCPVFIYIADKNLAPFKDKPEYTKDRFVKIDNGLPILDITPVARKDLGIPEDAFVVCHASRGIPEKGWAEAVEIVTLANATSKKPIHLLLLGEGEMRKELSKTSPDFVHFTGMVQNTRDYYSISDAAIFPTRFKGESYPLVLIEALQCGKPVIGSDVAEVKNQLTTTDGDLAGLLFKLEDWQVPVDYAAELLVSVVNDEILYNQLRSRCANAAQKFDIGSVVKRYADVYDKVLHAGS